MIKRYSTERMNENWSLENKFETYLAVEIAATNAWSKKGVVPAEDAKLIADNSKIDIDRILEIEKETKHDLIAFTRQVSETLGEERKWVHYGLTSTDVVDTAYAVQMKTANGYIKERLNELLEVLKKQAERYAKTPIIGRTHGIHADITSFGLKFALWYDEMQRNIMRFEKSSAGVETGKVSGAVGNFANTPADIQDMICEELGINSANISTQTLQRDRHAAYIYTMASIATSLEKMATEIRHLQRTEVREVFEYFDKGQKGSSAMPHKKNPVASENISGLARVMRGFVIPAMENVTLWHERDISHSSVERIIIPDATTLLDYMLGRFTKVLDNIIVDEERMMKNINATNGVIFAQRVLTKLIDAGLSRETAYDTVQPLAIKAFEEELNFIDLLNEDEVITSKLSKEEIEDCFDVQYFLKEVDTIFKRVFK